MQKQPTVSRRRAFASTRVGDPRLAADAEDVHVLDARRELVLAERARQRSRGGTPSLRKSSCALGWMFSSRRTLIRSLGKDVTVGLLTGPHVPRLRATPPASEVDRDRPSPYVSAPVSHRIRAASRSSSLRRRLVASPRRRSRCALVARASAAPPRPALRRPRPHLRPRPRPRPRRPPDDAPRLHGRRRGPPARALGRARPRELGQRELHHRRHRGARRRRRGGDGGVRRRRHRALAGASTPIRAQLPPDVARKLYLLSLAQTIPAPSDPRERIASSPASRRG